MTTTTPNASPATTTADFEFFQGKLSESRSRAQITVRRGGLLVLTRAAVKMLGEDVSAVQLAYNAKTGAIGIRASAADAPGCYFLRAPKTGLSMLIGGKRFFKHLGLQVDAVKTYDATNFGNGIVGFTLAPAAASVPAAPVDAAASVPAATPVPDADPAPAAGAEPMASEQPKAPARRKGNVAA